MQGSRLSFFWRGSSPEVPALEWQSAPMTVQSSQLGQHGSQLTTSPGGRYLNTSSHKRVRRVPLISPQANCTPRLMTGAVQRMFHLGYLEHRHNSLLLLSFCLKLTIAKKLAMPLFPPQR